MIPLDGFDSMRERIGQFIGQLPRPLAYLIIFVGSILLWSLIGIAAGAILRRYLL